MRQVRQTHRAHRTQASFFADVCDVIEAILLPIVALENSGLEIECANRKVRLCFPRLSGWIADHLENVTLHGIQQNQCPVCEVRPE